MSRKYSYEIERLIQNHIREQELAEKRSALDTRRGTLWWVNEEVWLDAAAARRMRYDSDRDRHPGMSIRSPKNKSATSVIPMLFGSSKENPPNDWHGYLAIQGIDRNDPSHVTYFGQALGQVEISAERIHHDSLAPGFAACPVAHKKAISESEMELLVRYLRERGKPQGRPA
jgi:hypothetical protein